MLRNGPAGFLNNTRWMSDYELGRTINSRPGYVTSQPFTVRRGSNEAKLSWCVWGGYYFRQIDGNQVQTNR